MPAAELFKAELFGGDQIVINGLAAVDERDLTLRADLTEQGIPLDATKSEIAKTFSDTGFSRLPVYDDDIDHIVGIVYQKDFHNHIYHTNKPLSSIIRPALFVTENTKVGPLLKKMPIYIVS